LHYPECNASSVISLANYFPIEPAMTGRLSVFLPSVPVDVETAGQLAAMARADGMTLSAYIRQVLDGYATGFVEVIETDGPLTDDFGPWDD
jgi:hypothetical protein